jgi:hypothetical protein
VLTNRGGPARPLSADELARKFTDNVAGRLPEATAVAVRDAVLRLGPGDDVAALLAHLTAFTA